VSIGTCRGALLTNDADARRDGTRPVPALPRPARLPMAGQAE